MAAGLEGRCTPYNQLQQQRVCSCWNRTVSSMKSSFVRVINIKDSKLEKDSRMVGGLRRQHQEIMKFVRTLN